MVFKIFKDFQAFIQEVPEDSQMTQYNILKYNGTTTKITAGITKPFLGVWGVQFVSLVFQVPADFLGLYTDKHRSSRLHFQCICPRQLSYLIG